MRRWFICKFWISIEPSIVSTTDASVEVNAVVWKGEPWSVEAYGIEPPTLQFKANSSLVTPWIRNETQGLLSPVSKLERPYIRRGIGGNYTWNRMTCLFLVHFSNGRPLPPCPLMGALALSQSSIRSLRLACAFCGLFLDESSSASRDQFSSSL